LNYIKIKLYKILNKLGPVTYKLKLLKTIKIYFIFYIALLELIFKNTKLKLIKIDKKIKKTLIRDREN
jgi:hypothetical protein